MSGFDHHDIAVQGRKWMTVSGVSSVESCDVNEITLVTQGGPLQVMGNNLHLKRLDLENGQVAIEGTIISMVYIADKKRKTSLVRKILR